MRPLDGPGAAELQEPRLPLTDITPPDASEELAAAEAVETPGPGSCWLCRSSPCGSRAQPGEYGVRTVAPVSPLGDQAGASAGILATAGRGPITDRDPYPTLSRAPENPGAVTWGQQSRNPLYPPARRSESF